MSLDVRSPDLQCRDILLWPTAPLEAAKQTVCGSGMQTVCEFVGLLIFYFRESVLEQRGSRKWEKNFVTHNGIAHGAVYVSTGEH